MNTKVSGGSKKSSSSKPRARKKNVTGGSKGIKRGRKV